MNETFRVATYNVAHCKSYVNGNENNIVDVPLTASVIRLLDAQIVGLNEIYENGDFAHHPHLTNQTAKLAVHAEFPYHAFAHACTFGANNEDIGNALFSQQPITKMQAVEVSAKNERYEDETGYFEDRVILAVDTKLGDKTVTVLATHFGLNRSEQEKMVRTLCELINNREHPLILMGDFNVSPDSPILAPIYERLTSAAKALEKENEKTFASYDPQITIDYIFLSKELEALNYEVINSPVSDHFPIRATVKFK